MVRGNWLGNHGKVVLPPKDYPQPGDRLGGFLFIGVSFHPDQHIRCFDDGEGFAALDQSQIRDRFIRD